MYLMGPVIAGECSYTEMLSLRLDQLADLHEIMRYKASVRAQGDKDRRLEEAVNVAVGQINR